MKLINHIIAHWDDTVRLQREDANGTFGLPYEYFVPCPNGGFQNLFYWDIFFIGKGLLLCGKEALLKSTVDDAFYLVDKLGYMPNANHEDLIGRSMPPFLSSTTRDLYGVYRDKVWLSMAYGVLTREYAYWMRERITPNGLNRFGYDMNNGRIKAYADMIRRRLDGLDLSDRTDEDIVENFMADAESGWDFNPRCECHQIECNFIDLNSLLYDMECNMAFFAAELANGEEALWQQRADVRREKIRSIMFDGETFRDYNFVKNTFSPVFSCASFFPLWAKIATPEEAASTVKRLSLIEMEHGLATCQPLEHEVVFQWDYPNGWAPLHYMVVYALDNYGYREDAVRIATKYVRTVEKVFEETGKLWEKYNVVEGSINVTNEYEMPEYLGWTASVYLDLMRYIGEWREAAPAAH